MRPRLHICLTGCGMLGWLMVVCVLPGPSMQLWSASRTCLSSAARGRNTGYMVEAGDTDGFPLHMVMTAELKAS